MKQIAEQIDNMSEEEMRERLAAEDDQREESPGASSGKALTSAPGEFSV